MSQELELIVQALQRQSQLKWQTVTLFQQKPPTDDSRPEEGKFEMKMEVDQRAEDTGLEKRLTLYEYQHEFQRQAQLEAQVFDKSLRQLNQLMTTNSLVIGEFIATVLRETETPFVYTQSGKPSIVADSLKAIQDEKVRQIANSF